MRKNTQNSELISEFGLFLLYLVYFIAFPITAYFLFWIIS